ncbi:MAG: ABC transporter permease subunit [Bacteroidetes bacterium]|nr:ABC transporter permease subunit [Bacteroidota bacterium]
MIRLVRFELFKMVHRPRTYLCLGLMVVLVALIFWGLKTEGENAVKYVFQALEKNFIIQGNMLNGYFVTFIILNTLWIHVPVLIVIVTGDLFSSELESGTIRLVLTRPVSRNQVALSKFLAALIFVFVFLLFWGLISLWPSLVLFGKGDLIVVFNGLQILEEKELLWRFVSAFGFAFLGMGSFAIFSVAVSFFTRKSLVTILISLGILVISTLVQTFSSSLFHGWQSFLITYHLAQWQLFFYTDIDWPGIQQSVCWLLGFSAVCIVASLIRFNRIKITE